MAILKVKNKTTEEIIDVKVDHDCLTKFGSYQYFLDKSSKKPFREVKLNNGLRRIFLDRDILGCSIGDGRAIYHKNYDPLDCRRDNLEEHSRAPYGSLSISSSGHHWPSSINSLLNFLEKRSKDPDEDLCSQFLSLVDVKKYSKRRIDLLVDAEIYDQYKKKEIYPTLKKVMTKYFDWKGDINISKIIASESTKTPINPIIETKIEESSLELKQMQNNNTFSNTSTSTSSISKPIEVTEKKIARSVFNELDYEFYDQFPSPSPTETSVDRIKRDLYTLNDILLLELLQDNKIFSTEIIIKVLKSRGAVLINF